MVKASLVVYAKDVHLTDAELARIVGVSAAIAKRYRWPAAVWMVA